MNNKKIAFIPILHLSNFYLYIHKCVCLRKIGKLITFFAIGLMATLTLCALRLTAHYIGSLMGLTPMAEVVRYLMQLGTIYLIISAISYLTAAHMPNSNNT